jgi:hypothetical protein
MKSITLLIPTSALALTLLMSVGFVVSTSSAQENMTTAGTPTTNDTGAMMGNQTNQTGGGNETQGPLEQLGEALGGVLGGNQSQ